MPTVTLTIVRAERRYSGVTSDWEVSVLLPLHCHRWADRGRHTGYHARREAEAAAERIARTEAGVIEVKIEEINKPSGMPIIMDASRDYGMPDGWQAQTQRLITL